VLIVSCPLVKIIVLSLLQHHIGKNWHSRAAASGGEYSITDDGRVRPKHVLIEIEKQIFSVYVTLSAKKTALTRN
jgi:hypothetical protein